METTQITPPTKEQLQKQEEQRHVINQQRRRELRELSKLLGFTPKLDGLLCAIAGIIIIDVIHLDDRLQTPDGVSLANHLEQQFGQRAYELACKLMSTGDEEES